PLAFGPVTRRVNYMEDHNTFATAGKRVERIGYDIGIICYRLLVCAGDAAPPAGRGIAQAVYRRTNCRVHIARAGRIAFGNVGDALLEIVERSLGPKDRAFLDATFQRSPRSAASIVASSRAVASSWGTRRPAFMSASPRWMPSIISDS